MRVTTDDDLRGVDARWLGVPGWTFPWRPTRYVAYGIGLPIAVVSIFLATRMFGTNLWPIIYGFAVGIAATTYLMRLVDDERPAATVIPLFWSELGTPRDHAHNRVSESVINLGAIPVFAKEADGQLTPLLGPKAKQQRQSHRFTKGKGHH